MPKGLRWPRQNANIIKYQKPLASANSKQRVTRTEPHILKWLGYGHFGEPVPSSLEEIKKSCECRRAIACHAFCCMLGAPIHRANGPCQPWNFRLRCYKTCFGCSLLPRKQLKAFKSNKWKRKLEGTFKTKLEDILWIPSVTPVTTFRIAKMEINI